MQSHSHSPDTRPPSPVEVQTRVSAKPRHHTRFSQGPPPIPAMSIIRLPDTLARWPFPRRVNPFYPDVAEESSSWLRSFNAFSPAAQRAFDRCEFGKLTDTWF